MLHILYMSITIESPIPLLIERTGAWLLFNGIYYFLDVHRRWGFFGTSESSSHLWFQIKNMWVLHLWALGVFWFDHMVGIRVIAPHHADPNDHYSFMTWQLPEWMRISAETKAEKILWALFIFYFTDFLRYWAHRIGHFQFFYRTWPFSHAHHHNQFFLNPISVGYSPFWHLANWGGVLPIMFFWGLGLRQSVIWAHILLNQPNITQHLGFDPFPWLTRINHYYLYGALPWVPLYHQYHHIPYVKRGNFGNGTPLWDYMFGTLIPESVEHIETGKMPERVLQHFRDPQKLDKEMEGKLKTRNRLDYNTVYDSSIFSLRYL